MHQELSAIYTKPTWKLIKFAFIVRKHQAGRDFFCKQLKQTSIVFVRQQVSV